MKVKKLQTAAMTASALLVPVAAAEESWLSRSKCLGIAFVLVLYACAIISVVSTFVRYRKEQRSSLANWRRTPYAVGLVLLLMLCLCPLATWPIAVSGASFRPHYLFLCLFAANVAAATLVWFGIGWWSRLGLTVVAYWICFLWVFPLALGS